MFTIRQMSVSPLRMGRKSEHKIELNLKDILQKCEVSFIMPFRTRISANIYFTAIELIEFWYYTIFEV